MTHVDVSEKVNAITPLCGKRDMVGETYYYSPKDELRDFGKLDEITCTVCHAIIQKVKAGVVLEHAVTEVISQAVSDCPICGAIKLDGERRICCT